MDRPTFVRWMVPITLIGLIVRLVAVAFASRSLPFSDGVWYHAEARILADGHGYLDPGQYIWAGVHQATAQHPPLFPFVLSMVDRLGYESVLAHQVTLALVGAAAIVAVGFLGRAVAGPRVGVIAAALAAVSPNIWQYDVRVLSEGLLVLTLSLFFWAVYRFWYEPSLFRAAVVGVTLAAATYTRAEIGLLGLVVVVPVAVWNPRISGRSRRVGLIVVAGLVTLLLMAPWTIRNVTSFDRLVLFSNNDAVVGGANCADVYYGDDIGSWNFFCHTAGLEHVPDQSRRFGEVRHRGIVYASDHLDRLPIVAVARVGRVWEVFHPFQRLGSEARNKKIWVASTLTFYLLAGLGVIGAIQLHRSRRLVWPLAVMAPFITVLAIASYGSARLRMPLDIALLVLAAVPIERFLTRSRRAPTDTVAATITQTSAGIQSPVLS